MKDVIKYIILEQLITEGRLEDAKQKYPCLPPKLVEYFSEKDPSRNNKYLDWMCKQIWDEDQNTESIGEHGSTIYTWLIEEGGADMNYCKQNWVTFVRANLNELKNITSFEEIGVVNWIKGLADMIIEEAESFHKFSSGLEKKDINQYNYNELVKVLAIKKLKSQEKSLTKSVTKIFEDDEWLIVSPKTHQASCAYGAHTKWCVTQREDDHYFKNYTQGNSYLMFVINKKDNDKWAINTDRKLGSEPKDIEVNMPWHREINLRNSKPRERFTAVKHNSRVERELRNVYGNSQTSYYNATDDEISWNDLIEESDLPVKLQELLKFVESKVKINFARKKKTDIAYESNENPIRLKKGDKVKLLASGHGYLRGDEGYVLKTISGAFPATGKNVNPELAGLYAVYVPNRKSTNWQNEYVRLKKGDKLLPKIDITVPEGSVHTDDITTLAINGVYLKKIS
jgi:hypothetical protein